MKFNEILLELLIEATPEQIYQKYYSDINKSDFIRIISLDPATQVEGENIKRIGKYSKLLIKMSKEGNLKSEDYPKVKDYLTLVYKHQVSVDMNKIKTLGDLFTLVEKYYSQEGTQNVFELVNVLNQNEYDLLMSGDKWLIYTPKSEKAAAYLGTGTEWCTAWGPYSTNKNYRDRNNHFTSHNNSGSLFIIIDREDPTNKYQFHFQTKQFMDKNDRKINTGDFFEKNTGVTKYFYPSLYDDDATVGKDELDRMYFLNDKLVSLLVEKSIGNSDNPIVDILINKVGDELITSLRDYITDDNLTNLDVEYRGNRTLEFEISNLDDDSDLEHVKQTANYYRYDSDPYADHTEYLRNDITERDEEDQKDMIVPLLKEYWDEGNVTFTNSFEEFNGLMLEYLEDIIDDYATEFADLNEGAVINAAETELNNIEKFIVIDDGIVNVPPAQLALFIEKESITSIDDLTSLFGAYVNFHDLVYEYENPMWNMNMEYPKLKDMTQVFDKYIERIEEEMENTPDCNVKREELRQIKQKYFNGGNYFSNNTDLKIELRGPYECAKGVPVRINYLEKTVETSNSWKTWNGHLTTERLVEYITNYRLLEDKF